jgi:hypothetical protein
MYISLIVTYGMYFQSICRKEGLSLPNELAERIALQSNRNLRRAILFLETCKVQQYVHINSEIALYLLSEVLCASVLVTSGLENRDYGRRESAALTMRHPLYLQKLALTSPTSGGRSVGIVRSRTKDTELVS